MHSYICTFASHLGTLEYNVEHAMLESSQEMVLGDKSQRWCVGGWIQKMEGLREYMSEQEMLAKRVSSNKH